MSKSNDSIKSSIGLPSHNQSLVSTPQQTTNTSTSSSGRRLRSSTRLRITNDNTAASSISSSYKKQTRLSRKGMKDVDTISKVETATTNTQDKVSLFMETIRTAINTLMQDHGYSRERAKISILDQLVSTSMQQEMNTMDTVAPTTGDSVDVSTASTASSHAPSLVISDTKVFQYMREKNIGMNHATIALTIEQTISSMLSDPNSSYASMSEILDTWIECLQHSQPKPLLYMTMKSCSAFGTPLRTLHMSTIPPVASQYQPDPSPSIKLSTVQHPNNPPCTPVCNLDATGNGKATSSHARTKTGGKKSNKAPISTPPLSTITISTMPPLSSSQQRPRAHSVAEAVSAKISSSTSGIDSESSQHAPIVLKGKPPLAPNTIGISSASGSVSASMGRSNSSVASLNSNSKRTNMDPTRLEDPQESSSMNRSARAASPSSLTLPSSNKRQRRSTSMSSGN